MLRSYIKIPKWMMFLVIFVFKLKHTITIIFFIFSVDSEYNFGTLMHFLMIIIGDYAYSIFFVVLVRFELTDHAYIDFSFPFFFVVYFISNKSYEIENWDSL